MGYYLVRPTPQPLHTEPPLKIYAVRDGVLAGRRQRPNTPSDENNIIAFRAGKLP